MNFINFKNEVKFMSGVLLGVVIGGASSTIPNLFLNKHQEAPVAPTSFSVQSPSKSINLKDARVKLGVVETGEMIGFISYNVYNDDGSVYAIDTLQVSIQKGSIGKVFNPLTNK